MTPRERNMLIALGVVAAAAVAFFFLVVRPGGAPDTEPAPTLGASPSPTPSPPPEEPPEDGDDRRPPGVAFFSGRNPFDPLVVEDTGEAPTDGEAPADGEAPTDGAPPDGAPTDGAPPDGAPPPDGDGDGDGDGDRRETITVGGRSVTLIDIFTEDGTTKVQVEVDGETRVVEPGQNFAGNFRLVSVQGGCANFLFGDQSFTLCEPGERK